jgi:hypothetical protein
MTSSGLVFGEMSWSRRRLMSSLAGAAVTLTPLALISSAAQAEATAWKEYRNADMGVRVEMPGEPEVEEENGDPSDPWIRDVNAQVHFSDMLLSVHCIEYRAAISADEQYKPEREAMAVAGMPVTREEARTVSGNAAREFIRESDDPNDLNYIIRTVNIGKRVISISVFGEKNIHGNPTARRLLDSLTLLEGGR